MPNLASPSDPLRTAVIGCGERGAAHMIGVQSDPRLSVVGISDVSSSAMSKIATQFELDAERFTDAEEMLVELRPDVVVLALWTDLHLPMVRRCVESDVALVMCEKPMARRWRECVELARLAEESKTVLTFCHQRRFAKGNRAVRELIASGKLGVIEAMDIFSPPHLLDCGTHSVDQARSFHGDRAVTWVHGAVDLKSTVEFFGVPAEAMATGVFGFEDGVVATLRTGAWHMPMWGGVRVTGAKGFIEVFWDGDVRRAVVYDEPDWQFFAPPSTPDDQMKAMVSHCVDCLFSGGEPDVSSQKALRTTEVLLALYESAKRHERIDLPLRRGVDDPLMDMLDSRSTARASTL